MYFFFFFNDTATTEIYTLSLHDALPISWVKPKKDARKKPPDGDQFTADRSEEHTSELQSHSDLVCRLLLEKKKRKYYRSQEVTREELHFREEIRLILSTYRCMPLVGASL